MRLRFEYILTNHWKSIRQRPSVRESQASLPNFVINEFVKPYKFAFFANFMKAVWIKHPLLNSYLNWDVDKICTLLTRQNQPNWRNRCDGDDKARKAAKVQARAMTLCTNSSRVGIFEPSLIYRLLFRFTLVDRSFSQDFPVARSRLPRNN
jgi:hypothetical protein